MRFLLNAVIAILVILGSSGSARADFQSGDPVSFRRDAYLYKAGTGAPPFTTALSGDNAVVQETFTFQRDPQTPHDVVNNPYVTWIRIILDRDQKVSGSAPLDDGTNSGVPVVAATPTGSFPPPSMSPSPTVIYASTLVTVTITPEISHHIAFSYDTLIRRAGTADDWQSIGGMQTPSYETGKVYNRSFTIPLGLTAGITSNLVIDLKTVLSFRGIEIDHQEVSGAIIVRPLPPFRLTNPHIDESGNLAATLTGIDPSKAYWLESSSDLKIWTRGDPVPTPSEGQMISIAASGQNSKYLRVSAE